MVAIDKFVRSRRKTLSVIVESDGTLTVRAPLTVPEGEILRFVEQKAEWIARKQAQVRGNLPPSHRYVDGENFLYLGEAFPLRLVPDQNPALVLDGSFRLSISARVGAEEHFVDWYKARARAVIPERVQRYARIQNFAPGKIRISSARTRWGSCSPKGTLSFTWRLVMAPLPVIDYVVVHELCHLGEMNHSRRFWSRVKAVLPDFNQHRYWLKENETKLRL